MSRYYEEGRSIPADARTIPTVGATSHRQCASPDCGHSPDDAPAKDPAVPSNTRLCRQCRHAVERDLGKLPVLYAECGKALERRRSGVVERVAGSAPRGIPLNADAVEARSAITRLLAHWSARVARERGIRHPGTRALAALAEFLIRHLDWVAAHPAAGTFVDEIRRLARAADEAANKSGVSHQVEVGTCVDPHCDSAIVMSVSRAASGAVIRCNSGHAWAPHEWLALARRLGRLGAPDPERAAS